MHILLIFIDLNRSLGMDWRNTEIWVKFVTCGTPKRLSFEKFFCDIFSIKYWRSYKPWWNKTLSQREHENSKLFRSYSFYLFGQKFGNNRKNTSICVNMAEICDLRDTQALKFWKIFLWNFFKQVLEIIQALVEQNLESKKT